MIPLVQSAQWDPSLSYPRAPSSIQVILTFTYSRSLSPFLSFYIRSVTPSSFPFSFSSPFFLCLFSYGTDAHQSPWVFRLHILRFCFTTTPVSSHSLSLSLSASLPLEFFSYFCFSRTLLLRNDKTRRWIGLFGGAKVLGLLVYVYGQMGCPSHKVVHHCLIARTVCLFTCVGITNGPALRMMN